MASDLLRQRELEVAREIAHAFLTSTYPLEVYRLALARVMPLVNASFGSVFLRDGSDTELLRLVCAQNWPQGSARFLSQLRIRVGRGPTGRAVEEGVVVATEDVFADPTLREWWEPARELGFASLISIPLAVGDEVAGALSFYFGAPHRFDEDERELLSLIADQLAATAQKAHLIENLQTANERLTRQNAELMERVREAGEGTRLKNEFLANMSHELRTPLTSILGYAYLLLQGHAGSLTAEQASAVQKIDRSGNALLGLIGDLLELSQLKLGRAQVRQASDDAVALAERAIEATEAPPDAVPLRLLTPDGPITLRTDREKVVKILENLLSNAFKFTTGGEVTLTVRRIPAGLASAPRFEGAPSDRTGTPEGGVPNAIMGHAQTRGWVEWLVEDTGIGIRPEDMDSIFDEFRQVDGSSTRLYGGTGLGLALSLRLARLLGGDLMAESEPGRGSTFMLRLPLVPPVETDG